MVGIRHGLEELIIPPNIAGLSISVLRVNGTKFSFHHGFFEFGRNEELRQTVQGSTQPFTGGVGIRLLCGDGEIVIGVFPVVGGE